MSAPAIDAYRAACAAYEAAESRVKRAADARAAAVLDMAACGLSLAQIAGEIGTTRARVSQLIARARMAAAPVVADPYSAEILAAARGRMLELRATVRELAATMRVDSLVFLADADASTVRLDGDWLQRLHRAEIARLRARWTSPAADTCDVVAESLRRRAPGLARFGDDEVMERVWLFHTRIVDAAGALARGRVPSPRRYSGRIDLNALAPTVRADGYDVNILFGDDDAAARHVAEIDATRDQDEAWRLLGDVVAPEHGPAAWRMTAESYALELVSIDAQLAGDEPLVLSEAETRARRLELVPKLLDDGSDWETLHAAIVATARLAGVA